MLAELDVIHHGDCLPWLKSLPDNSIDACITDPPYGLGEHPDIVAVLNAWLAGEPYKPKGTGFMCKEWDAFVPGPEVWREVYRVLKPGGYCLSFAGTRTYDLMTIALRLAGFEVRDQLAWLFGSGFPKSLNISKAMDRAAGVEREVIATVRRQGGGTEFLNAANAEQGYRPDGYQKGENVLDITAPATEAAQQWAGWGTALKPAHEPICMARKPIEGTVIGNVSKWGCGGINIDGCKIGDEVRVNLAGNLGANGIYGSMERNDSETVSEGRWPSNVILDPEAAAFAR